MKNSKLILTVAIIISYFSLSAQILFDPDQHCIVNANDACVPNVIITALPFLRITPDARSAGMGDVGLATSADPNAMFHNASKLAFSSKSVGASFTYTPWLRSLGLTDVFLLNASGYNQIDELQTIGLELRYFSLGDISFTDFNGNPLGEGRPREMSLSFAYARKLSKNFSAGLTTRYANSNLATGLSSSGTPIVSANVFAADISFTYHRSIGENELTIGTAITNLGNGVSYTNSVFRDNLPANFGIGTTYKLALDSYNTLSFSLDFNKLLVPTPIAARIKDGTGAGAVNPLYDEDANGIADYKEKSTFGGVLGSLGDGQGGFSEEIREITFAMGVEYVYDEQFAVRTGYFHESFLKGNRKFITAGLGVIYNVVELNLSYLVPTNGSSSPLDNTLRFSINFNFGAADKNDS